MGKPKQPIHGDIDKFSDNNAKLTDRVTETITKHVKNGETPSYSVNQSFSKHDYENRYTYHMSVGIGAAHQKGIEQTIEVNKYKKWYLGQVWESDKLTVSQRVHKVTQTIKKDIIRNIRIWLNNGMSWIQTAQSIDKLGYTQPTVAKTISELDRLARRYLGGDTTVYREYKSAIKKAQRHVNRLAQNGAPTTRLKKAYQSVIKATEKGSIKMLDTSMKRSNAAKIRYNSERMARAEIARAYGQGRINRMLDDKDATGYVSLLSSRHPRPDVCDFHAEVDLYGMGAGVYPRHAGPPYPYHPMCSCILRPYYGEKGRKRKLDKKAAQNYIENSGKKSALLGKAGTKEFNKNPNKWQKQLNNWNGHERKRRYEIKE